QPAGQQRAVEEPDALQRLLRLGDRVTDLDHLLLLEHVEDRTGAARDEGSLRRRRAAWPDADAQPAGRDHLTGDIRVPEGEDVAGVGRAHAVAATDERR